MIYFVRHGQTDRNLAKKLQGRGTDISLNEVGMRQAKEMRDELKDVDFAAIFVSPLLRARQTAEIIAEAHKNTPLFVADELIDRDFGEYEGWDSRTADDDYPSYYYDIWNKNFADTSDAEKISDLEKRVFGFLERLAERYSKNENVLLVAHGGVGLVVSEYFEGEPEDGNMLQHLVSNGKLQIFGAE